MSRATLIRAIKKQPCLWDPKHPGYLNKEEKTAAWNAVCKEIYVNWDSKKEQYKCLEIKKKWTNIRDYYRKELQKMKESPTKTTIRYKYADSLAFLLPVFRKQSNVDDDMKDYNESEEDSDLPTEESPIENKNVPEFEFLIEQPSSLPESPFERKFLSEDGFQSESPTPSRKKVTRIAKTRNDDSILTADEDDDTKFLLSFRGDMRRMSINQKMDFKIGMLQLVKKLMNGE